MYVHMYVLGKVKAVSYVLGNTCIKAVLHVYMNTYAHVRM